MYAKPRRTVHQSRADINLTGRGCVVATDSGENSSHIRICVVFVALSGHTGRLALPLPKQPAVGNALAGQVLAGPLHLGGLEHGF